MDTGAGGTVPEAGAGAVGCCSAGAVAPEPGAGPDDAAPPVGPAPPAGAVVPPAPGDGACVLPEVAPVAPDVAPDVAPGVAPELAPGVAPGLAPGVAPELAPGVAAVPEDPAGVALGSALMTAMICSLYALSRAWISESGRFRRSLP